MNILVLGGDGYVGWPLSVKLALKYPHSSIHIIDNLDRRRLVQEGGGNSITDISSPPARLEAFRQVFGQDNLHFIQANVAHASIDAYLADLKPEVVFHLAQQASAPWSMKGVEEACYTLQNNEAGNMRILWAIRTHVPDAHLIKLGTFGEYCKCGIDIPEGYYYPTYNGKTATRPAPFPRETDDIYHVSKINDTNYISLACRKWGLRVTDVMQSTIYGVWTEETFTHPELYTRLDYCSYFGTVVNRFLAQTIAGHPMTVYGTGWQRTGLMALQDSLHSLCSMIEMPPQRGEHKVVNHVTERDFSINCLAEAIYTLAQERGFKPEIQRGRWDPRVEQDPHKADYHIETHYLDSNFEPTPLSAILPRMFEIVAEHQHRINAHLFAPQVAW